MTQFDQDTLDELAVKYVHAIVYGEGSWLFIYQDMVGFAGQEIASEAITRIGTAMCLTDPEVLKYDDCWE